MQTGQSSFEPSVVFFAEFEGYQRKDAKAQRRKRGRMKGRSSRSRALVAADIFRSFAVTGFQVEQAEDF